MAQKLTKRHEYFPGYCLAPYHYSDFSQILVDFCKIGSTELLGCLEESPCPVALLTSDTPCSPLATSATSSRATLLTSTGDTKLESMLPEDSLLWKKIPGRYLKWLFHHLAMQQCYNCVQLLCYLVFVNLYADGTSNVVNTSHGKNSEHTHTPLCTLCVQRVNISFILLQFSCFLQQTWLVSFHCLHYFTETMSVHPEVFCLQCYKGVFTVKRNCFNLMVQEGWQIASKLDWPVRVPCFFS